MSSMPASPAPAALPVCTCKKASHDHGTRDMYGYHRCGAGTREGTRARIEAAHAQLRFTPPPSSTRYERSAAGAALAKAAANGWTIYEDEDFTAAEEDAA
jgi:hypothetical protein